MVKKALARLVVLAGGIGFLTGFLTSIGPLAQSVEAIGANRYIHYRMFRLAALNLREPLWNWLLHILVAALVFAAAWVLWRFAISRVVRVNLGLDIRVIDKKKLRTSVVVLVCLFFLVVGAWLVNSRWATAGFSLQNLLLNEAVLFLTVLLGWILLKTRWENAFKRIRLTYILGASSFVILLFLMLSSFILIYPAAAKRASGPNIVLIAVDCLRAGHLGCYGYDRATSPNIDSLAGGGVLFKNSYSNAAWTKPALASLFTSLYPNQHGTIGSSDALADEVLTLAEVLKNSGYRTFFVNGGNPVIGDRYNFYQGFTAVESVNRASVVTERFLDEISAGPNQRFFAYLHYMDLHLPYHENEYNESFSRDTRNPFLTPGYINRRVIRQAAVEHRLSDNDKNDLLALYDGQIKFVDASIGKLVARLRDEKILDNTVVIITADHGEEFWEHGNFEHGHSLYNELLHIPLIIVGKGWMPARIEAPVSLVDLLPTILDMAHIRARRLPIQGKSLLKLGGQHRPVFATGSLYGTEKYGLIAEGMKLVFNSKAKKKPLIGHKSEARFELYDLQRDPHEKTTLVAKQPGLFMQMKKALHPFLALTAFGHREKQKKVSLDKEKEHIEKLKSLGYL